MHSTSDLSSGPVVTETPFRLSLGGGSTDLPSYYEKHGGFIFAVAIDFYIHVFLKRLRLDPRVQFHYTACEVVESVDQLNHELGREALKMVGIKDSISVTFNADSPAGTGLGSSGSYAVGLLMGLYALKGEVKDPGFLAEKAFEITQILGWSDGKQDPYLAAYGGFLVLDIDHSGAVTVTKPQLSKETVNRFLKNTALFYTGVKRPNHSSDILKEQGKSQVLELKHQTKSLGLEILRAFRSGDLDTFGLLMDKHWRIKRQMSNKISSDDFDGIYELGKKQGALGGKLVGAGGGGYFVFYCPTPIVRERLTTSLVDTGLRPVKFDIDYRGSTTTTISRR